MPLNFLGDKTKIYRILVNLINNSINYTSNGSIELNITCEEYENNFGVLKFEVKDTGIGMKKEHINMIFDEFSTTNEEKLDIKVIGLGLLIVKELVNMLDAKVTFSSEYGVGSVFTFVLNQRIVGNRKIKDFEETKKLVLEKNNYYFDCSKYKILVVDDNQLNRKVIQSLLKTYKVQTELLDNGKDCIEKVKQGEIYDLILLDHMMPEMDGIEVIKILRKMKIKKLPPIIMMTANAVTGIKEKYLKEGFDDYLAKPVDTKELNKLMLKYFETGNRR